MEEKTITIKMKGPRPERRVLKSWNFWAFTASAIVVTVVEAINESLICGMWAITAAVFKFFADLWFAWSQDFEKLSSELIIERETIRDALREKDNKIAELQTEIISLRFGKTTK